LGVVVVRTVGDVMKTYFRTRRDERVARTRAKRKRGRGG
jgi:hypothetical protein